MPRSSSTATRTARFLGDTYRVLAAFTDFTEFTSRA